MQKVVFYKMKTVNGTAEDHKRRHGKPFAALSFSISCKTVDILPLTHWHRFALLSLLFDIADDLRRTGVTPCYKTLKTPCT